MRARHTTTSAAVTTGTANVTDALPLRATAAVAQNTKTPTKVLNACQINGLSRNRLRRGLRAVLPYCTTRNSSENTTAVNDSRPPAMATSTGPKRPSGIVGPTGIAARPIASRNPAAT